jgi:hypothetical protein
MSKTYFDTLKELINDELMTTISKEKLLSLGDQYLRISSEVGATNHYYFLRNNLSKIKSSYEYQFTRYHFVRLFDIVLCQIQDVPMLH